MGGEKVSDSLQIMPDMKEAKGCDCHGRGVKLAAVLLGLLGCEHQIFNLGRFSPWV